MNAMTWWDHQTESVWSQVWGQAIDGELKGATLNLIPTSIVPWGVWRTDHPDTLAMTTSKIGAFNVNIQERPHDDWVIGVALGEDSRAFYFISVTRVGLVNDAVGPFPVVIYANRDTRQVYAYVRNISGQGVTLSVDEAAQTLVDDTTGRAWQLATGLPVNQPDGAEALLPVPYVSSFDWAWKDFHPHSSFYR